MKTIRNIFLTTRQNGRGKSLFTVPGQMLTSRTRLEDDMMTHGCEKVRRNFPAGTVFYTTSDKIRLKSGCYLITELYPLLSDKGESLTDNIMDQLIIDEYMNLTEKTAYDHEKTLHGRSTVKK